VVGGRAADDMKKGKDLEATEDAYTYNKHTKIVGHLLDVFGTSSITLAIGLRSEFGKIKT
jgi:hypothetical protein